MLHPKRLAFCIDGLWLTLLAAYVLAGAALAPFHGDESTQLYMGRDFYLLLDGDWQALAYDSAWTRQPAEQHLRLINGTVTKTIHGFLAWGLGMPRDAINGQWDWELDYAANSALGNLPDGRLLQRARWASAAQLALAGVLLFALLRMTIGRPEAVVASALFCLHPVILLNGRRAMMEGSHLLGLMLVLLAAAWLLKAPRREKFVLLGIASGFAVAAKHPNAFVVALVFLACAFAWRTIKVALDGMREQMPGQTRAVFIMAGVLALLSFYALNPAWWQAPVDSAVATLRARVELLNEQVARYGGYGAAAEKVEGFLQQVFFAPSQYYEVAEWANYEAMQAQISAYEASGLAGIALLGGAPGGAVLLALTLGVIVYLALEWRYLKMPVRLLIFTGGGIALVTLVVTPLPWQRYYLPALPFALMAAAIAITRLARLIWHRMGFMTH